MRLKISLTALIICCALIPRAQSVDSTERILDEVVITGTRTENNVKNLPMPIQVISGKAILQSGAENLLDLLQMHTGLVVAVNPLGVSLQGYPNPFGTGIQMQGLDPAYTLILIDGEPLTGRNAGILDMGRVALGNIKQIEILRGPATSLYGSDALAGVINVITRNPEKNGAGARLHYGSNNAVGLTLTGDLRIKKTSLEVLARRYSNEGWDYSPGVYGNTMDPYHNYTINAKTVTRINEKNTLVFSGRYFSQKQKNDYLITPDKVREVINGYTVEEDKSIYGKWDHKVHDKLNFITSVYATSFDNHSDAFLKRNDSLYEQITLDHFLLRPELQVNVGEHGNQWTTGGGYNFETINSNRYSSKKQLDSWYGYLQKQWTLSYRLNMIAGARLDKNTLYSAQLSPKLAAAYKVTPDIIIKGSIGAGFKAPDFRQQFLNFSNSLIGYTILGARELGHGLERLQQNGLLSETVDIQPYMAGVELTPERSVGVNLGVDYTVNHATVIKLNFFRNDINHLIETYNLPFNQVNDKAIFSYINVDQVFTQGGEFNLTRRFGKNFNLNAGYNFLIAKDKQVVRDLKEGKIYRRDPYTGRSGIVQPNEYKGLYNRSKHTANINFQYHNFRYKAGANLAAKYRGKYGFQGINDYEDGNEILDHPDEFAEGFALINLVVHKNIGKYFMLQAGVENLLDYTQTVLMPSQFGRSYFVNVNFKL